MFSRQWLSEIVKWPYNVTVPLLLIALGVSPFFTGTDTYWFGPPLVCVFAMGACLLMPGLRTGWDIPRSATAKLWLAFALLCWVSVLWSKAPFISILFAYIITTLPFLSFLLLTAPKPGQAVRLHVTAGFLAIAGFAIWACIQLFFMYEEYGPRIHHPMLSPNNLAALFIIGLFLSLSVLMRVREKKMVVFAYALILLMMLALVATQSRAGMIFTVVAMLVYVFTLRRAGGAGWGRIGILAAMAGFCYAVVNFVSKGYLAENVGSLSIATQINSTTDRLALFQSAWQMMLDHFWTGIGLGTFYFTYPTYRKPIDMSDGYFVHCDPLQFGTEMGVLGTVLFYALLTAILLRTIRAMLATPKDSTLRVEIMAPFCAMLALAMHSHFDFHLYLQAILLLMALPMALWYRATEEALNDERLHIPPPQKGPLWAWQAGLVILMMVLVNWPARAAWSAGQFPHIQKMMEEGRVAEMEAALKRVVRFSPRNNYRYYQYLARFYVWKLYEGHQTNTREQSMELYKKAEENFAKAIHYNKDFSGLYTDRARLYFTVQGWLLEDGFERAQKDLEYVTGRNPLDWDARVGLVQAYQQQGHFKKALAVLQQGRQWPMPLGPRGLELLLLEAQMHLKLGDRASYDAMYAQAKEYAFKHGYVINDEAPQN